ncbi:MAG: histidinol-phosphate transaminase [Candidatus Omnitrophica bacterium]|nr:histidinol-phosphate transaminase [Candidatus Omnitrophota bacterium]
MPPFMAMTEETKKKYPFGVKERIARLEPYRPGKPIDEVKRELGLKDVIKLASNESPYGPSPKVLQAMRQTIKQVNRYPDGGCFYLRDALAKHLGVEPNQLIFGNGSDEVIVTALRAFVQEGEEVVIAKPSFLIYEIASCVVGAQVKAIPLKDFQYDLEGMKKAVSPKTKMIFIGNPDNPAGSYVSQKQLENFLNEISSQILVFVDEAYFEYVQAADYPDTITLLSKYPNLIIARTFSKMYGLAGLRVGFGIARSEVIDILNRLREPFNVNSIAQAAALACLKDQAYYRRIAKEIEEQRKFLYQSFEKMGLSFVKTVTNFLLIDVKTKSDEVSCRLLKKGVIVRDMAFWGLPTFIRVTIGAPSENRKFLRVLKEILKSA